MLMKGDGRKGLSILMVPFVGMAIQGFVFMQSAMGPVVYEIKYDFECEGQWNKEQELIG